jgi:hypothetical protein
MFDFTRGAVPSGCGLMRMAVWVLAAVPLIHGAPARGSPDQDGNGFVDSRDHIALTLCFNGPQQPGTTECFSIVDFDHDKDVDLADFSLFQLARGHLPIPLRDTQGNILQPNSTVPYSGRQTCAGECHAHDIDRISNGFKFQQGRTDLEGNIIVEDNYFSDGRWWQRSPGRYGTCNPGGGLRVLAAKQSCAPSQIDLTTFRWVAECTACHPGGGPGEFDRDGMRFYDSTTGLFGYEQLGKAPGDVLLDGDYAYMSATGVLQPARWDLTGVSEPDCLHCHLPDPAWNGGGNNGRYTRRAAAAAAQAGLVDDAGAPVPAFAAAGVAGQGWFSSMPIVGGKATKLQIDYGVGLTQGSLTQIPDQGLALPPHALDVPPRDEACWLCHGPIGWVSLRGGVWFDPRDFHYAKLNNLLDDNPQNDISPQNSTACNFCHPGNVDHNFAKGNSLVQHSRQELDWVNLRSCRSCHLENSPTRHPDAPPVPGNTLVHLAMWNSPDKLSCQACHIPQAWAGPAQMRAFRDSSMGGPTITYQANLFYSANPVDPSDQDKSSWYPGLYPKVDEDGVVRLFPSIPPNLSIYWGDLDDRGTPERSDDLVIPIASWRFNQIIGSQPLPVVTDDNNDGKLEINRPAEMLAYMTLLKGVDSYGTQVAAHPVLVRGRRIWYEDASVPEGVGSFDAEIEGVKAEGETGLWGINHNVRRAEEAWGYDAVDQANGCRHCHRPDTHDSPVFDRLILIDPFGPEGQPVYASVRELTGLNPP